MAAHIFLKTHTLSYSTTLFLRHSLSSPSPSPLFHFKPKLSLSTTSSDPHPQTLTQNPNPLPYGPSLQKGTKPSLKHQQHLLTHQVFEESSFTRVFDIAALRVPANDCFAVESRLRGHLLNWPRIRNIARVPGDDVDAEIAELVGSKKDELGLESVQRRIRGKAEGDGDTLSPVLYREKLVDSFDSRGFVRFRNLAKISRPKRKKGKKGEDKCEEGERKKGLGNNDFVKVEVVEEKEDEEGEDLSGLLGDEFKKRKWKGSTRLLLLDERCSGKKFEDLPEALKAVLEDGTRGNANSKMELVSCKVTLFYDYWSMNEVLEALLPEGMIIPSAFETVGHIAHLNLREEHLPYKNIIAKVVLDKHKRKIQTVVNKIDAINNEYRTMQLEILAGNHSLVTTVVENGIRFNVDLVAVYWSSRLNMERQRLISSFTCNDVVCDVFCGVGPIAIAAAKKVKRVYANDLNPHAVEYLERNCVINKVERKVEVFNMDGRRFISSMFASKKAQAITQIVMNLPKDAVEFLDAFRGVYRDKPRETVHALPVIHLYGFSKAQDPEYDFHERIRIALSEEAVHVEMHQVRLVSPGKWMLCGTFTLPQSVAFSRECCSYR